MRAEEEKIRRLIRAQLTHTLDETGFSALGERRRGKVRDIYARGDELVLVATDRLSAFDWVLSTIPFKGEILTGLATYWFARTEDIVDNHLIGVPAPAVMLVRRCEPLPIELIVRGYLAGSSWRAYERGERRLGGVRLPEGMSYGQKLPEPVVTPTTKAAPGERDMPIEREGIVEEGLVDPRIYDRCHELSLALYERGTELSEKRGLVLADTKYEMGLMDGGIVLIDEVHTPDSSRYWIVDASEGTPAKSGPARMLDKENIRRWLVEEHGYSGEGEPPAIPDDVRVELALTYLEAFERITGEEMELEVGPAGERLERELRRAGYL